MIWTPLLTALMVFAGVFVGLRLAERAYHSLRRTPDWSPHWGSWVFALLCGVYVLINELGRRT